jgi:dihydroneopterin aldolase
MSLAGAGLDRILLRNLRVFGHHGVLPGEAEHGQVFVIDLDLALDLRPAGRSDDLERTVDYGSLAGRVADLVAARRRNLVEAVAEDVADLVLADGRVREVRVRVTKPHAPLPVDAEVAVEVVRGRQDPPPPAGGAAAAAGPTGAPVQAPRGEAP